MTILLLLLRNLLVRQATLIAENLALRQQLAVLRPSVRQPRLRPRDGLRLPATCAYGPPLQL
jgi:hypothetical protein